MLIISDFRDYYDIHPGHEEDTRFRVIYKRKTEKINEKKGNIRYHKDRYFILGFCGKLYPICRLEPEIDKGMTHCYSFADIDAFVNANPGLFTVDRTPWCFPRDLVQFFKEDYSHYNDWFIKYKTPIFVTHIYKDATGKDRSPVKAWGQINPRLQDWNFGTQFDAYRAYQEIEMYMADVLKHPHRDMAKVDDEHRYAAHGFDKQSFRTPKGRKKKRRKHRQNCD